MLESCTPCTKSERTILLTLALRSTLAFLPYSIVLLRPPGSPWRCPVAQDRTSRGVCPAHSINLDPPPGRKSTLPYRGDNGEETPTSHSPSPAPPLHAAPMYMAQAHEKNEDESKAKGSRHASIIQWRPRRLVLGRRRGDGLGAISSPRIHGAVVAPAAHHVHFAIRRAHGHHDVAGSRLRFPGTLFRRGSGSHGVWHIYAMIKS